MEDGRGQGSIRPAFGQRLVHVPCRAGTARGDNGQPDGAADRARQLYVVSGVRAVVVHRREQDLPRSQLLAEGRPLDRVASGRIAAAVAVHLPAGSVFSFSRVDRQHDALRAEDLSASRQQSRVGEGRCVDRDLVRAVGQQLCHVRRGAHAASYRERDEHLVGRAFDRVEQDLACIRGRGDVEKDDLVRALAVVDGRKLGRIACVTKVFEAHALDDATAGDVEAWNDALGRHQDRHLTGALGATRTEFTRTARRSWHRCAGRRRRSSPGGTGSPSRCPSRRPRRASGRSSQCRRLTRRA